MDGNYPYKVNHQGVPNDLVKGMRSEYKLPVFRAGGNQVPYYLGVKGNYESPVGLPQQMKTPSQKVQMYEDRKATGIPPSYLYADF